MTDRQIVIAALPQDTLEQAHFRMTEGQTPAPGPGEVTLRVILMSIDAANRSWMKGATYRAPVHAGDPMPTYAIGQVERSEHPELPVGTVVLAPASWCERVTVKGSACRPVGPERPLSHHLSVYGIAGKTAYHGLVSIGRPVAGETVLVSAAAGSVGGIAGQIARALGCRVVGIAGGPEKCAHVVQDLGFDACVDYRAPGLGRALAAACPDGVDVYFDNVGGRVLEAALFSMAERGRVVCCGAISQYDTADVAGPRNLPGTIVVKRLRMEGFIVSDFARDDARALRALRHWVEAGQITPREDIFEGLERAPAALIDLLAGGNTGKRMVRVAPDPGA